MEMKAEDGAGPEMSPAIHWFQLAQHYLSSVGLRWDITLDLPGYLREAGFIILQDVPIKMQLWPDVCHPEDQREAVAEQYLRDMCDMVENMAPRVFRHSSSRMKLEEGKTLASEAAKELETMRETRGYHTTL